MIRLVGSVTLVAVLATACTPQNATLSDGQFTVFLANNTSLTLANNELEFSGSEAATAFSVDCRDIDDPPDLPNTLDNCSETGSDGQALYPPQHERWMTRDGFRALQDNLDPWRGGAVVTSEGDFQVTFHHRLAGGADFRFAFAIDPNFQPRECIENDAGNPVWEDVDGNWLDGWSTGNDGTTFFLNSGAFQFSPNNTEEQWYLPQEWQAGYARSRFAEEDFFFRRPRYGTPSSYSAFELDDTNTVPVSDLFYSAMTENDDPTNNAGFQALIADVNEIADQVEEELGNVNVDMRPMVQTNEWRQPDGFSTGLDAWVELHYSWVRFDDGADLSPGGSATGEFNMVFDGGESQSVLFVKGSFSVENIKKDKWTTRDVNAEKLEENNTNLCGGS